MRSVIVVEEHQALAKVMIVAGDHRLSMVVEIERARDVAQQVSTTTGIPLAEHADPRSIHVSNSLHAHISRIARATGRTMTSVSDEAITAMLDALGAS